MGGVDEELCHLVADEIGEGAVKQAVREGGLTEEPARADGVYLECVTSFIVGIYPAS